MYSSIKIHTYLGVLNRQEKSTTAKAEESERGKAAHRHKALTLHTSWYDIPKETVRR